MNDLQGVRDLEWDRLAQIRRIRDRIWLHLSPTAEFVDEVRPDAATLLQLGDLDLRHLARLHFLLGSDVHDLLEDLPRLVRRLATSTVAEEEWSVERLRGAIEWGRTVGARAATGLPHLYVTAPAERAYQTPENELLVHVLDSITTVGRETRLAGARSGVGQEVANRVDAANSWRRRRALSEVERRPPTPRSVARVRSGRGRARYDSTIRAYDSLSRLVVELDRSEIKRLVEERAIAVATDSALFEVLCTFDIIDALKSDGWKLSPFRLFGAPRRLEVTGNRGAEKLVLSYQHTPSELGRQSFYASVLHVHGLAVDWAQRRPDLTLRFETPNRPARWLLVEVKFGTRRTVLQSARAALADLLSYRREFTSALDQASPPYGLGIAWGAGLQPSPNAEALLVTPDHITEGVRQLVASASA